MKSWIRTFAILGFIMGTYTTALAQQTPYQPRYATQSGIAGGVHIIVPAQTHPEVAVSRELAAQPVHPWMVQVELSGVQNTVPISTYIDPMQRLDGDNGLDQDHSLVRAQRLYNSLTGVTTSQIAALSNASLRAEPRASSSNHVRIITNSASHPDQTETSMTIQPIMVIPHIQPAPAQPRETKTDSPIADAR